MIDPGTQMEQGLSFPGLQLGLRPGLPISIDPSLVKTIPSTTGLQWSCFHFVRHPRCGQSHLLEGIDALDSDQRGFAQLAAVDWEEMGHAIAESWPRRSVLTVVTWPRSLNDSRS